MPRIKKQDYLKKDFTNIQSDIENLIKVYFPNEWKDFNVASAGMALVDLLAYVSDLLSYYTDKRFNELFLDGVSERSSAIRLAKTLGYKVPGVRGASTLVDLTITVPALSTGPDPDYLPLYRPGVRFSSNNIFFETINQTDFSNDYSETGAANRIINPIFDSSQNILGYNITKREFCVAGQTTLFKKVITDEESNTPFLEITLPEQNVLEILDIIVLPGTNITSQPSYSDFKNFDNKYYEVDHLAQDSVFLEDTGQIVNGFSYGVWTHVNKRFTKEYMSDGSCKITFGGGSPDVNAYQEYLSNLALTNANEINYQQMFDNTALGEKLPSQSTLFIRYRIGGGENSNVGTNSLGNITNINAVIQGSNETKNNEVLSSTRGTNIIPALGGKGLPTVDEIRYSASSNFASQERCIHINDYISRARQLPGRFGSPFKVNGKIDDNKVKLYVLSKDGNGKLSTDSSNLVKTNLYNYMQKYRAINDFIEINNAKFVNLMFEIDLFTDKTYNSNEIKLTALNEVKNYFTIDNWEMGQHVYISQINDILREIPGVINVVDIRAFNVDGGNYSSTLISQANGNTEFIGSPSSSTRKTGINYIDNAIYSTPLSMFEVRYPEKDILVRTS
jgi:hypothetical protein